MKRYFLGHAALVGINILIWTAFFRLLPHSGIAWAWMLPLIVTFSGHVGWSAYCRRKGWWS